MATHTSDCAVHNLPAFEPGPCDCGAEKVFSDTQINYMASRFLRWQLPRGFNPDGGVTFTPPPYGWPVGTNLLTADQARAMIVNLVDGLPELNSFE